MDIERLKKKKAELGYTNKEIAELSGVPLGTVQKVFGTVTKMPVREDIDMPIEEHLIVELYSK